jgi:hypothetical protein
MMRGTGQATRQFGHQVESIMGEQWHYSRGGKTVGPVSALELKRLASSGQLAPTDLVWKEGMPDWVAADQLKGLFVAPALPAQPQREQAQELITCKECPRCEAEHLRLPIKKLSKPTYDGFTHWGVCPTTGDPVLFNFMHGTKGQH